MQRRAWQEHNLAQAVQADQHLMFQATLESSSRYRAVALEKRRLSNQQKADADAALQQRRHALADRLAEDQRGLRKFFEAPQQNLLMARREQLLETAKERAHARQIAATQVRFRLLSQI